MDIAKNSKATAKIVLSSDASKCERFAAQELASYIKQMSGAELEYGTDCDNLIYIGYKYAQDMISDFDIVVTGPEGFIIKSFGNKLLIAGNKGDFERGTLYGVYEFLERYLGCSFGAYGNSNIDMGEYVPKCDDISIADTEYISPKCDVQYRCAIVQYDSWVGNPNHKLNVPFISWLAKNRYNRIMTWAGVYEGFKKNGMIEEAQKRGIVFSVGHHESTKLFLPPDGNNYFPEKYYETHPEYYKLTKNGERFYMKPNDFTGQLVLCMRNEDCIRQMAENIIKWTDENENVDVISLWPNDGTDEQCCCEECSKYTKSDNYTYFVGQVAEIVAQKKPNIKIDRIVYCDLLECEQTKIPENVIIDEAVWLNIGLRKIGNPDGSGYKDTEYERILLDYRDKGAKVVYYDYLMGIYGCKQKILPAADEMQSVCKRFVEQNVYGLGSQMEAFNHWNNIFNFYTYGRTAYNTDLSMNDNLERFARIFGGGTEEIKKILIEYEKCLNGEETIDKATEFFINNIDCGYIYDLFEKALEKAETKQFRNNIRMMRMAFRYSDLEVHSPHILEESNNVSGACDDNGELWYMSENFSSYNNGKEGFGIAIPVQKTDKQFTPNKWYIFE